MFGLLNCGSLCFSSSDFSEDSFLLQIQPDMKQHKKLVKYSFYHSVNMLLTITICLNYTHIWHFANMRTYSNYNFPPSASDLHSLRFLIFYVSLQRKVRVI
jgi:hypothetical protein